MMRLSAIRPLRRAFLPAIVREAPTFPFGAQGKRKGASTALARCIMAGYLSMRRKTICLLQRN
jgi:hypothetical protein